MKNDDELFLLELEFIVEDGTEEAAQSILGSIDTISERLESLRQVAKMRVATRGEGRYLYQEIDRLRAKLQALYAEHMLLYNILLESASQFARPNEGNPD